MKPERTKKDRLRADILLIAALLALALGFFAVQRLSRKDGALAVVYVNGERTAEYPLAEDTTVTLHAPNGGYNILVISGGTADVTEASCPDRDLRPGERRAVRGRYDRVSPEQNGDPHRGCGFSRYRSGELI